MPSSSAFITFFFARRLAKHQTLQLFGHGADGLQSKRHDMGFHLGLVCLVEAGEQDRGLAIGLPLSLGGSVCFVDLCLPLLIAQGNDLLVREVRFRPQDLDELIAWHHLFMDASILAP